MRQNNVGHTKTLHNKIIYILLQLSRHIKKKRKYQLDIYKKKTILCVD